MTGIRQAIDRLLLDAALEQVRHGHSARHPAPHMDRGGGRFQMKANAVREHLQKNQQSEAAQEISAPAGRDREGSN